MDLLTVFPQPGVTLRRRISGSQEERVGALGPPWEKDRRKDAAAGGGASQNARNALAEVAQNAMHFLEDEAGQGANFPLWGHRPPPGQAGMEYAKEDGPGRSQPSQDQTSIRPVLVPGRHQPAGNSVNDHKLLN